MKLGFGASIWVRDNHFENMHRMLDEMSMVGFDGVELFHGYFFEQYGRRPQYLKQLLQTHDLELSSVYQGLTYDVPEQREQGVAEYRRRCQLAAEVGAKNVLLDGGRKRPNTTPQQLEDHIQRVAETANMLGEHAQSLGLQLSWHQHWGSIFEVQAPLHRLMELTDPAVVGFCPDVAQLSLGDFDVPETVRRYAHRVRFVHYKDVTFAGRPQGELWPGKVVPTDDGGYSVDAKGRMIELGRGVVDFPAITKILLDAGYDGWLVDDHDLTPYACEDSAQACKDYINYALGIWGERDIRRGLAPKA
jgi:inosose dehydratase